MLKNTRLSSFLIYFIPVTLITGPFIPDLLVSLISLIFLYEVYIDKNTQYFKNKFFILFSLFYSISLISSLFSENIFVSLQSSLFYFRFALFALCIYKNLNENFLNLKILFYFLLFDLILLNLDGYFQFFLGHNLIGIESVYGRDRLNSFFGDEYILGSYLTRIIFLFVGIAYKVNFKNVRSEFFLIPLTISTYILVFLSGERTAFFLFTIGIIIFFILSNYKLLNKVIAFFVICISLIVVLNFNQSSNERYLNQLLKELGIKNWDVIVKDNNDKRLSFLPQHSSYFIVSYEMFKDKKFLGHGNKSFSYKCHEYKINAASCSSHPHNTYIQILAENGIINFVILGYTFLYLVFFLIKTFFLKLKKKNNLNNYQLLLIISVFITLWPLTQTGNFFNNWLSILYFLPVGFILHEFKK